MYSIAELASVVEANQRLARGSHFEDREDMLPEGILFDLDDTIIAFDAVADPTWKHICEEFAGGRALFEADTLYDAINKMRRWYWSDKDRHRVGRI